MRNQLALQTMPKASFFISNLWFEKPFSVCEMPKIHSYGMIADISTYIFIILSLDFRNYVHVGSK